MEHGVEYWKKRAELAEAYIEAGQTGDETDQALAYQEWMDFIIN